MKKWIFGILLLFSTGPFAREMGLPQLEVKKYVLENGLRLLVYENNRLPIFTYYTLFDIGGRHESVEEGTTGATHYLEHMLFWGTASYPRKVFDSIVTGSGGRANASTSLDMTDYFVDVPIEAFDKIVEMEADRMENLVLREEPFEIERQVIFEERKTRLEDRVGGQIYQAMMETVFKGTPYGGSVIGSREDIENLRRERVMEFYKNFYTPDNAIIVVAGDVTAEEVYQKVRAAYGGYKRSSPEIQEYRRQMDDPQRFVRQGPWPGEVRLYGTSSQPMFRLVYNGMGATVGGEDSYAMNILVSILNRASFWPRQKYVIGAMGEKPLLANVGFGHSRLRYNGLFIVAGRLLEGVVEEVDDLDQFRQTLSNDLVNSCEAIDEKGLQRVLNQYLLGLYGIIKTNNGVAQLLGQQELFYDDYAQYRRNFAAYQSVTVDQVREVCSNLFAGESMFISLWDKHPQTTDK